MLRGDALDRSPVMMGSINEKFSFFADDKLNYDVGLYYYKVQALESVKGNGAISESNEIELIQAPLLYVPNAWTANSDGLNDFWGTVPVFVKDFNLKLFTRWGEKIWETSDRHEAFSNFFKETSINSNVFVYVITYTGWDDSVHKTSGNVTMLK
jgi:gliding motility-associated-like protein